eukprot:TRINITY_DN1492_c0_g1_i1.p1 TRINITY_DN1492_c0_g1~~TRINITY_DN1492_c0_g1_i1.p1  ORF type:complete len:326 (-),score=85.80 TRINITY_DN1492_c0_g1_i1:45-1022(-)
MSNVEVELPNPPEDGISNLCFAPDSNLLAVSSWDKTIRVYDCDTNTLRFRASHKAAVLDCVFGDRGTVFAAGLDGDVKMHHYDQNTDRVLGSHSQGVSCMGYSQTLGQLVTGSYDHTIKIWDTRQFQLLNTLTLQEKVWYLDVRDTQLVVATAGKKIHVYDLRTPQVPIQVRDSPLKNQTRCISVAPAGDSYGVSSIEGRAAIEFFSPDPAAQKKRITFKCHRDKTTPTETIHPVNVIAFHPHLSSFATGGSDGIVNIWDGANKKRLCQLPRYSNSVASLSFNYAGNILAVAASYTWDEGDKPHGRDQIILRSIQPSDVTPKAKV